MKLSLRHVLVAAPLALFVCLSNAWGQGPGTLLYDHFGVSLLHGSVPAQGGHGFPPTGLPFDHNSFVPYGCPANLEYIIPGETSDGIGWYGYWNATYVSSYETYWGQWPSGSEPYDVEAYYGSVDDDNIYVVVVSSAPGPQVGGIHETRSGMGVWIFPGDLTFDLGLNPKRTTGGDDWSYDFGLDLVHEQMPTPWQGSHATNLYDSDLGSAFYRTNNGDWYASCDQYAATAHDEHTNFDPNAPGFSGTYLGDSSDGIVVSYYEYDLDHNGVVNSSDYECNYATYVIEASIPRTLLGADNPSAGDTIRVRWVEGCRNDGNTTDGCAFLVIVIQAALGDYVWLDEDRDGIQDVGESGVEGVTTYLYSSGGQPLDTTVTNSSGLYAFYDLAAGDYYVKFDLPTGYMFSPQNQGSNDSLDSDVDPSTGVTEVTTLNEGENDLTWDVGIMVRLDFGDAPDPSYPTFLASNGARHVVGDVWMGSAVDVEWNGQPTGQDDLLGTTPDDEDGVVFLGSSPVAGGPYVLPYRPGWYGAVQITVVGASKTSYLHGWYDWNADSDWLDSGEHIIAGQAVSGPGVFTMEFSVPSSALPGGSWSRFRLDDDNSSSTPMGQAGNGEVEDYDPTASPIEEYDLDFGDAPDATYPSYWANDGASHVIDDIWLGAGVSSELDTRQINADDDDGIILAGYSSSPSGPFINPGSFSPGDYAAIDFVVSGNVSEIDTAYLHIWIDWDRSGDWAQIGELVVDTALTATGAGRAVFTTPAWLQGEQLGTTWVRARLDRVPVGSQLPTGMADNGEVEDYGDALVAVELSLLEAVGGTGKVVLRWQTASETENLGFDVYRSNAASGPYVKITSEPIPGAGTSNSAKTYTYVDLEVAPGSAYYYKLADIDFRGQVTFHGPVSATVLEAPKDYVLHQNYPNPFNPSTTIKFTLAAAGSTSLKVYNLQGQLVCTLVDGHASQGTHSIEWNGTDDDGRKVPSGIYLCILTAKDFKATQKMEFLK